MKRFGAQKAYLVCMVIMSLFVSILSGCGGGGGGTWTEPVIIKSSVTVTSTVPLNTATVVAINSNLTATFSEAMDPATIISPASSFTLKEFVSGTNVAGAVTYVGNTATFNPTGNLSTNTKYSATITTAAKTPSGKTLASNFTWTFTTGLVSDTTAPTLLTTAAADGAIDLPINRNSTATFSEPMDPATLISPATTFTLKEFVSGANVAGTVTYIGNTATFNPTSDLKPNTKYTSTVTTAAKDLAGNALVSGIRANPWSWTTGAAADIVAPTITATNPLHQEINVPINKQINAFFSEEMRQTTIITTNFTVKETVSGLPVNGTVGYTVLGNFATFRPLADLRPDTDYTATVSSGAKDLAGNALAAGLKPNPWTFRTAAAAVVPPGNVNDLMSYGIASAGGITNTGATKINGNVVLAPNDNCNGVPVGAGNNFGLCAGTPPTNNTGDLVITQIYPDTTTAIAIRTQLLSKWNNISPAGTPLATLLGCGVIGSAGGGGAGIGCAGSPTLPPGTYISATNSAINISGNLTLDAGGDSNAVWVIQAPSALTSEVGANVILANGAKASNVWWYVGSSADLKTNSTFNGNVLASAAISMGVGSTSCGRLFSGAEGFGAFTFLGNMVSVPGHPNAPLGCN